MTLPGPLDGRHPTLGDIVIVLCRREYGVNVNNYSVRTSCIKGWNSCSVPSR
jgi:hypothetical protein